MRSYSRYALRELDLALGLASETSIHLFMASLRPKGSARAELDPRCGERRALDRAGLTERSPTDQVDDHHLREHA
jgi:hypothetical protein